MFGSIEAPGPDGPLRGSFTAPASEAAAAVLIIPGSGPTNRDGNNPLGIQAAPYKYLAEELGRQGIASVRIDKRGMFASALAVADANTVTIGDYVDDVGAWIAAIRQRTGIDRIWLLGHSEGGLVALAAASRLEHIAGLILVATAGRPLGSVLKAQLRANPDNLPLLAAADTVIDALTCGTRIDVTGLPPALAALFPPAVQGFLISAFRLDPAELIRRCKIPILILQGERDIQVDITDAERLQKAQPSAVLTLLADTNHVLKRVTASGREANIASYADPSLPLAPGVVDAIVEFCGGNGRVDIAAQPGLSGAPAGLPQSGSKPGA